MKSVSSLAFLACLSMSSVVFVGQQMIGGFEEMKNACRNPAKFHSQISPTNIQVSCRNVQLRWLPDAGTSLSLETNREVTTFVNSDKYTTSAETKAIPSEAQTVSCPAFKQVIERVEAARVLTCDQLLGFQGSATEFCTQVIDSLTAENPEAINVQATGRVFNMCAAPTSPAQQQQAQLQQAKPQQQADKHDKKKPGRFF